MSCRNSDNMGTFQNSDVPSFEIQTEDMGNPPYRALCIFWPFSFVWPSYGPISEVIYTTQELKDRKKGDVYSMLLMLKESWSLLSSRSPTFLWTKVHNCTVNTGFCSLPLNSQNNFCHTNKINHLGDAEQGCYDHHPGNSSLVEGCYALISQCLPCTVNDAHVDRLGITPPDHLKSCLDHITRIHREACDQPCSNNNNNIDNLEHKPMIKQ